MTQPLARSAQSVQDVLRRKGLECKVIELTQGARTASEAASALGCTQAQIMKSLIFKTKTTNAPVLILVSGINRVNEKVIESYVKDQILRADPDFVREMTGFAIGGIPPVGHKSPIQLIFIDEDLLVFDDLWAAAGTPNAVFNFKSKDLVDMTQGKVVCIR